MGKKIQITESQFKRLMKTITEVAAGYDDFYVMYKHGGKSISLLIDTMKDLLNVFKGIQGMLESETIEYVDLKENFKTAIDLIGEISKVMTVVFKDFTDRKVIKKGELLLRSLESYQERLRTTFGYQPEDLFGEGELKSRLIDLTQGVSDKLLSYTLELQKSAFKFKDTIQRHRDRRNPNMN
jgi:hypothetical protein